MSPYESLCGIRVINLDYCYAGNTKLKEMPMFGRLVQSASHCFDGCISLTGDSIRNVANFNLPLDTSYMFANCKSLKQFDVSIPKSVETAEGMFLNCEGLETAVLNSSAKNINRIFEGCVSLTGTILFDKPPEMYADAFKGTIKDIKVYSEYEDLSMLETYNNVKQS